MSTVEKMALIVVALAGIKLLVILINPKAWVKVIKTIYSAPALMTLISLVLAGLTLNYLLEELTIVQIFGSMLFFMFLMMVGVSAYHKEVISWTESLLKKKDAMRRAWLSIIVWVVLLIWVFYSLFM